MDAEFMEFHEDDQVVDPIITADQPELSERNTNLWLGLLIIVFQLFYHFTSKLIDLVVSLTCPKSYAELELEADTNSLKKQLLTLSHVDDFAKYSKIERKIVQNNVKHEELIKTRSSSTLQTKVAFQLVSRILSLMFSVSVMWNYSQEPVVIFPRSDWWTPMDLLISAPTGISGALGLPFFSFTSYYFISTVFP